MSEDLHRPRQPVRIVTAASLFDGHDAAINIMRRLLQAQGAEVVHLGHNRSVDEVVDAVVCEDAQGVAVSSYQGGHVEYFRYLVDRLRGEGRGDVHVFGGGGGVITPAEIETLRVDGVSRIFTPEDGQRLGLARMVNVIVAACDVDLADDLPHGIDDIVLGDRRALARTITGLEAGRLAASVRAGLVDAAAARHVPVLGITGTGGSGKSSLTDELLRRFRLDTEDKLRVAVLAVDPSRRRGGGALLGDRIRMNALAAPQVFFRSLATRSATTELPDALGDAIVACKAAGYDLVVVETPGIGQGDAAIVPFVDVALYVMTPEFGAASQLEKIDMLDFADVVAVNKFDRRGGADAVRDVRRQLARNREDFTTPPDDLPVFGTVASRFRDDGVNALHLAVRDLLGVRGGGTSRADGVARRLNPPVEPGYLAQVTAAVRRHHATTEAQAAIARRRQQLAAVSALTEASGPAGTEVADLLAGADAQLDDDSRRLLDDWPATAARYAGEELPPAAPGEEPAPLRRRSLAGTPVPRVALPRLHDHGDLLRWLRSENLPGRFPFTAGVFPFRRQDEDPARMFAGEGDAVRTNRRFHLLAEGQPATRLSTAFDSVTLYGSDPDERPDVFGKIGNSGVSIATLDDMKLLFAGFDLCDPSTSVSMTINGPAPTILAMFLTTAIDQRVDAFVEEHRRVPEADELADLRAWVLRSVRGTVQADILKEDQGQNTCIFSTDFSLGVMADVAEWFVEHDVRNFYSASISGYHIAEAGANPVTQLAFTLANAFTYVEAYLARGLAIDDFAPNLSFFFSNGMDPEYTVIGRVARRIWAIALRDRYGAGERAQKLKYHVQTSGRSLHAQEMAFNDIRTTLQALCAISDNANSLHTNAYDEALTTPTDESVRRALAIQLVISREWGATWNENPLQGSFVVEELTDLVEEAVLAELDRIDERGGVLGAMETGYQRGRIQDESMRYEQGKHDGSVPIVGVNTFVAPTAEREPDVTLARSTDAEKQRQLDRLRDFQRRHAGGRPAALAALREVALGGGNVFAALLSAVRCCTLGEITDALFEVGGRYRRSV